MKSIRVVSEIPQEGSAVALPSWVPDRSRVSRPVESGVALQVALQPIVDLASGAVVGAEALARFPDSAGVSVSERFAAAHAGGRGAELEAACLRAALRRRDGLPDGIWMSVNVSPDALGDHGVQQALAGELSGVVVEVTESAASDPGQVTRLVAGLRERGALIAVDDASTGYAGLLRLSRLRPDIVKLDAGLVTGVADSVEQSAVIEALVSLSRRIGARVLGEGVESVDDLRALVDLDVDYAQGWVLARPGEALDAVSPAAIAACRAARQALMRRQAPLPDAGLDLHRVTAALAGSVDPEDLSASLRRASTILDVDVIGLSILAGGALREIASADTAVDGVAYSLAHYPATRAALTSGRMIEVHLDEPRGDAAERAWLRSQGFASLLITPLIRHGAPLGILEFTHRTARRWTSHDLRQAHILADHVIHVLLRLSETAEPRATVPIDATSRRPIESDRAAAGPLGSASPQATAASGPSPVDLRRGLLASADPGSSAIGICDENGRFLSVSASLARMLQRAPEDILGRPYLSFVHPDQRATSLARYHEAVTAAAYGEPTVTRRCELRCVTPADTPLWVSITWTVLEPDRTGAQFAILHVTDTTATRPAGASGTRSS